MANSLTNMKMKKKKTKMIFFLMVASIL